MLFAGALTLLLGVRVAPILSADFPLGAGGLFAVMALDLRDAGLAPPAFTTYNDGTIPFVYPPLGIYVLALVPGDPIQTERWLPLLYSFIAVAGAWLLARELVGPRAALAALPFFVAMPVTWAIEGGGVTRALGFALLLLALWRIAVLVRDPSVVDAMVAGLLAGLALLSHPSVGPAGAVTAALLLAARPSLRAGLFLAGAALVALLVVMPWLVTILSIHGVDPLLRGINAHDRAPAVVRLLAFGPSWLANLDPVLPAALLGFAVAATRREWLVPVWLLVLFLIPGGDERNAALAWALLAGQAALFVYDALRPSGGQVLAAGLMVGLLLIGSLITSYERFRPVPADIRAAMVNGPPPLPTRFDDPAVEWYPALAGRPHPLGYFGYEWTPSWNARLERYMEALE
jgi:hypothetical protein